MTASIVVIRYLPQRFILSYLGPGSTLGRSDWLKLVPCAQPRGREDELIWWRGGDLCLPSHQIPENEEGTVFETKGGGVNCKLIDVH